MGDIADNSSPAIANGVAYIGSFDGRLYAFDANGCGQDECQPLWSGATENDIQSSPAVMNNTVYISSAGPQTLCVRGQRLRPIRLCSVVEWG